MLNGKFEQIKERFCAFWENEAVDRCAISVTAPLNTVEKSEPCKDLQQFWTDPEIIFKRNLNAFQNTYYGAEAFPRIWVNLGPGITAAYLGSKVEFRPDTVWFGPETGGYAPRYKIREDNSWWKITKELTRGLVELSEGKYPVSITDLSGTADILSHLRGTENLCIDLFEQPEQVKKAREEICDVVKMCYDELFEIAEPSCGGSVHWLNLWAPGKHFIMQCDLSVMLSRNQFNEFFLPEILRQCDEFEYSMYHLDGPGEIQHLDSLLAIKKLKAVQWVPLPGQGCVRQWMPLFKRIKAAKKALYFAVAPWYNTSAKDVEYILSELPPEGLFLDVTCSSREEADWLLANIDKWSCAAHRNRQ